MKRRVKLTGTVIAKTPLNFTLASEREREKLPVMPVYVEELETVVYKAVIPPNSFRGALRHYIACDFLKKLYEKTEKPVDYLTYLLYACGGFVNRKEESEEKKLILPSQVLEIKKAIEKTLLLSLFGGVLPYPIMMIPGKISISPGYSDLNEEDLCIFHCVKKEEKEELVELIEEGALVVDDETFLNMRTVIREGEDGEEKREGKTSLGIIIRVVAIPQGTVFRHFIELQGARDEEIGLLLKGLQKLSEKGLGGLRRFGFGKVVMDYTVLEEEKNKWTEARIRIDDGKIEVIEGERALIEDRLARLDAYFENLSREEALSFYYESFENLAKGISVAIGQKAKDRKVAKKGEKE